MGPVQASIPPSTIAHSRPTPVIPATLRAMAANPPGSSPPVDPRASAPIAAAVSATVAPSLRYGSQRPVARSGSPNGP